MSTYVKQPAGEVKIPFGKHQGLTLDEVMKENAGYLDWLGSQPWITGYLKGRLHAFLSQPAVQEEMEERFPIGEAGEIKMEQKRPAFIAQEQVAKRFNLGKPQWIRPVWRTPHVNRKFDTDWHPVDQYIRPSDAWDLAADLCIAIEECESLAYLDLLEKDERIGRLQELLPRETMLTLRAKFTEKRDRFSLLSLFTDRELQDALLLKEALDEEPALEAVAREQASQLMDAVELLRLS